MGWFWRDSAVCSPARCGVFFSLKAAFLLQAGLIPCWYHPELCSPLQELGAEDLWQQQISVSGQLWWLKLKVQTWLSTEDTEHADLHRTAFKGQLRGAGSSFQPGIPSVTHSSYGKYTGIPRAHLIHSCDRSRLIPEPCLGTLSCYMSGH